MNNGHKWYTDTIIAIAASSCQELERADSIIAVFVELG